MGKKTVLIVAQTTLRKKVCKTTENGTDALHAESSSKIVPADTGSKKTSGTNMYISGKQSAN